MVDPIDKPASRKKTYDKIVNYFNASLFYQWFIPHIAEAAAKSMIDIMDYVFVGKNFEGLFYVTFF